MIDDGWPFVRRLLIKVKTQLSLMLKIHNQLMPPTTHHITSDDNGHADNEAINKSYSLLLYFMLF